MGCIWQHILPSHIYTSYQTRKTMIHNNMIMVNWVEQQQLSWMYPHHYQIYLYTYQCIHTINSQPTGKMILVTLELHTIFNKPSSGTILHSLLNIVKLQALALTNGPWPGHQPGQTLPRPTWSPTWPNLALTLAKSGPGVDTIIKQTTLPHQTTFQWWKFGIPTPWLFRIWKGRTGLTL